MLQAPRIGIDEARLLALREHAAGAALATALAPLVGPVAGAATLAAALAGEGHELDAAARGQGEELARRLDLAVLGHRSPLTLHVVAVLFERVAEQLESTLDHSVVASAASLRRRAYEAWRLLAKEGSYLQRLLGRIAKNDEAAMIAAVVAERPAAVLAEWVRDAQPALLLHAPRGVVMLRVLRALEPEPELAESARAARESLVDALLAPLRHEDIERSAARAAIQARVAGLAAWAAAWHASERDPYFALRTLERLVELGWELRSLGKYPLMRELYAPFRPMLELLANEVQAGGRASSYASLVGDAFVQVASSDRTVLEQIVTSERALAICPRHKLAESMLAFYLAQRGLELMVNANDVVSSGLRAQLVELIQRARKLDPNDARLAVLIARYQRVTGHVP